MRELVYLLLFFAIASGISFGLAWLLTKTSERLSRRRILLLAALPVPGILIGLAVYMGVRVSMLTAEECGVDACAYTMIGVVMLTGFAIIAWALGWASAGRAYRRVRPSS